MFSNFFETLTVSSFKASGQTSTWAKTNFASIPVTWLATYAVQIITGLLDPTHGAYIAIAASVTDIFSGTIHFATQSTTDDDGNSFRIWMAIVTPLTTGALLGIPLATVVALVAMNTIIRMLIAAKLTPGAMTP